MLLFMKVLFTQFIAEMGDKTQLMLVAMTSRFKLKDILLGTCVAVLVLNGLAVLAGGIISMRKNVLHEADRRRTHKNKQRASFSSFENFFDAFFVIFGTINNG